MDKRRKQILRTGALLLVVSVLLACSTPLLSPTPVEARTLGLQGWGGWIVKLDSNSKYSESLSKSYVEALVPELASKGYNLIRYEARAGFLGNSEYSKIRYPVLDLLVSKALSYDMTVVVDPIHDFPPETESYEVQSNYGSWLAALKEVGYRYNEKSNVILECINEYILSDAYTKFQKIVTDLRNAGITLPLHFNYMWNSVGELKPLTDPLNKVSVGHHVYGNHDDDWRKPYSGESWLSYVKRIGVESTMSHMFTSSEKLWFGYPLSQGRAVMCTEVGASIRFRYSPWNIAYVMRFLEYSEMYGVGAAVFRIGYSGDKDIYEQKAKEYFGRSLHIGSSGSSTPNTPPSSTPSTSTSDIFSDDFESGSFSEWSNSYVSSGESAYTSTSAAYTASIGAVFQTNGGGGYEYAHAVKMINATPEIYMRGYIQVVNNGLSDIGDTVHFLRLRAESSDVLSAGWRRTSSGIRWHLWIRDGSSYFGATSSSSPSTSRWYSIEAYWLKSGSGGKGILYVDGSPVVTITGRDTDNYGDVTRATFGVAEAISAASTKVYGDNAKISTKYIGPE